MVMLPEPSLMVTDPPALSIVISPEPSDSSSDPTFTISSSPLPSPTSAFIP
jgi:hypothetical protein